MKLSTKNLLQLELLFAALVVNFFAIIYDRLDYEDYKTINGFIISSVYILLLLATFIINFSKRLLRVIMLGLYVSSIFIIIFITYLNHFEDKHILVFLFVYTFFAFVQERVKYFLAIAIAVLLAVIAASIKVNFEFDYWLLYGAFATITAIGFAVSFSREYLKNKTERRQSLLHQIFNNSTDGLLLFDLNTKDIIDCNQKFVEQTDYVSIHDLIKKKYDRIHVREKLILKEYDFSRAVSIELKDGRIFNMNFKPINYDKRSLVLVNLKTYKNRNELNKIYDFDKLLEISEESFKYLFEESSSLICLLDKEGILVDVNKTTVELTGYSKEELIGKRYDVLDKKDQDLEDRVKINAAAWNGASQSLEKVILDKKGNEIEIEVIIRKGKYFGKEVLISNSRNIGERKKLERELVKNYDKFIALFELSPIGILAANIAGRIVDVNNAFIELVGYSRKELLKMSISDITIEEDLKETLSKRNAVINGELISSKFEKRYRRKDGKIVHVILNLVLQRDTAGNPAFLLGQVIDITDIKESKEELENSERSYRDIFDNSYDLLYILSRENKFLDINKAVLEKYGYDVEAIKNSGPELFAAENLNDLDKINEQINLAWEGKEQNILWWSKKKNGDIFPKDLNLRRGIYYGQEVLVATGRDISDSYHYERELEKKEKRYRDLFERNLAGVYRTNRKGLVLECNRAFAKIFGFSNVEEIKEKYTAADFYVDNREREKLIQELDQKNFVESRQVQLRTKDGKVITVLLNVSKIEKDAEEEYFEGNLIDISDLYHTQELLSLSEAKYKQLVDDSTVGILIFDLNYELIFLNLKAAQLLGFSSQDYQKNIALEQTIAPENKSIILPKIKQALQSDNSIEFNFDLKTTTGLSISAEGTVSVINFEGTKAIQLSFIDISDRKKAEQASEKARVAETYNMRLQAELKEKEKAQRKLIDAQSYTEGIIESSLDMIFTTDIIGKINKLNSAATVALRIGEQEYLNKPLKIIFKDESKANEILDTLKKENQFSGEVTLCRSDNTEFAAYFSITYLYNSEGTVLGIMGVSRDISYIKKKEDETAEQAAKLNAIIESSSHFFFTVNNDYDLTSFNHVFKNDVTNNIGYELKKENNFFDIVKNSQQEGEDLINYWKEKFQAAFNGGSVHFEIRRSNTDGNVYYREIYLNPIYRNNRVWEVSGIGHDITAKKISEQNLKSSLAEKEVLLKEVHHRVKNNMQVISSILSLQSSYVNDEKILAILRESQNRIKSMAFIHERLYRTDDFSNIKFSEYVSNLASSLVSTYELSETNVELNLRLEEVFLNLDSAIPCGLIINELISNSLKYAFKGKKNGQIELVIKEVDKEVTLIIADDGIGIDPSINFKETETLGLQLVNTLAEQLEGKIECVVKNGTIFTLTFKKQD